MYDNEYSSQLPELGRFLGELGLVLQNSAKFGMADGGLLEKIASAADLLKPGERKIGF